MSDMTTATFPALELRVPDESERIVEGIVVPWAETSFLTSSPKGERFVVGSLSRTIAERGSRVKLFRSHGHQRGEDTIGTPLEWNAEDTRGLWGRFKIGSGDEGDRLLTKVGEGILDAFSIGFAEVRSRRGSDGAREILEAKLGEVSLTSVGAYDGARVLAVRTPAVNPSLPAMPTVNLDPIPQLHHW